jgi:hypothetical protein
VALLAVSASTKVLLAAGGVLVLTLVHHVYGALLYATPWRLEVAYIAVPALLALMGTYATFSLRPSTGKGRVARWLFVSLVLLVPVLLFGLIEGGYNHVVKNALYFGGASDATLLRLFPPPTAELPNDFWFEATGILQLFAGVGVGWFLVRWLREDR